MTLPESTSVEAVAGWRSTLMREATAALPLGAHSGIGYPHQAFRALDEGIRALVEAKVREGVKAGLARGHIEDYEIEDAIVSRVLGAK